MAQALLDSVTQHSNIPFTAPADDRMFQVTENFEKDGHIRVRRSRGTINFVTSCHPYPPPFHHANSLSRDFILAQFWFFGNNLVQMQLACKSLFYTWWDIRPFTKSVYQVTKTCRWHPPIESLHWHCCGMMHYSLDWLWFVLDHSGLTAAVNMWDYYFDHCASIFGKNGFPRSVV